MKKWSILLSVFFSLNSALAKELVYDNHIYEDQIKTVLLYVPGTNYPVPVIKLNSSDKLHLSFDEFTNNNDYYQYTLVHCDANWKPTNLRPLEYMQPGNLFTNIDQFKFSNNTYKRFVHYDAFFPSKDVAPKISGNYLLKVYRNFDESDLIITRKIFVLDNKATFTTNIQPATLPDVRFSKQEVDFSFKLNNYQVIDPFNDLKVVVSQNNRWDNAITNLKPQFIVGNEYTYNYERENLFDGTNEYRFFDFRSLRFFSQNVESKYFDEINHLVLRREEKRGATRHLEYIDFNGKRVIANKDGQNDGSFDGDYAWVYFSLSAPQRFRMGEVYIFGELSDWQVKEEFRMTYNESKLQYEGKAILKQGYYSYLYVTENEVTGALETVETEGNYMETENDYYLYVYCRNQSFDYDELIGFGRFNTRGK